MNTPNRNGMYNHTGRNYSQHGMMDFPRFPIAEMNFGKFPDSMEFHSWQVNVKTEVCTRTADPQTTIPWIMEVEEVKSIDELKTSRSIEGKEFLGFGVLDAAIASALKKLLNTQTESRRRANNEEQRAQNYDRSHEGDKLRT